MSHLLHTRHILLADDDKDDSILFQDVLEELPLATQLVTVYNGEELMQLLNEKKEQLPDVLFLDLNMPCKNGLECLSEIKRNEKLKHLSVIILSTSFESEVVDRLYKNGAQYYIRKPNDFAQFKEVIYQALTLTAQKEILLPLRKKFVLSQELAINGKK